MNRSDASFMSALVQKAAFFISIIWSAMTIGQAFLLMEALAGRSDHFMVLYF
ncbi:MAG: hypothetical protein MI867_20800 [Pseudomonadales bacterium]|nr:hypothetical protein [Pseudomonadales bacterium]